MKTKLLLILLTLTSLANLTANATDIKPRVYVADFCTRDRAITDLTMKLTSDFEVALSGTGKYEILERRDFDQLRAQAKNEAGIAELSGMPDELVNALKTKSAEMVIFGEVFDDVDSGQVSVTVSFVTFSGEKRIIQNVKIPRGKINDSDSRTSAVNDLVKRIVTSSRKVVQTELNGLLFQVVRCHASDRVITIDFLITNNEDDKKFKVVTDGTLLFDNNGNRNTPSAIKLANVIGSGSQIDLISGVPIKASFEFQGANATAEAISRLDLYCWESGRDQWFTASFRNLPIER